MLVWFRSFVIFLVVVLSIFRMIERDREIFGCKWFGVNIMDGYYFLR